MSSTVEPPEVTVRDESVPEELVEAVEAAVAEHPLAARDVSLGGGGEANERVAEVYALYRERPSIGPDGEPVGWVPSYRSRELVEAELRDQLPDRLRVEPRNSAATSVYVEVGR